MKPRFWPTSVSGLVVAQFISAIAEACPSCASRADLHPWATAALIGSLISMPYLIGAVVLRAVRKLDGQEEGTRSTDGGELR